MTGDHDQKAEAWDAVWDELRKGNPAMASLSSFGMDCALLEIRRLRRIVGLYNAKCDEVTRLKAEVARLHKVAF